MVKALVTGSAGFLGAHVSKALSEAGFDVTGFDQNETRLPNVGSIVGDLLDPSSVNAAVSGHDVVCHIGAIGDVYLATEHPELAAAVNVTGSAHVAAAAKSAGAKVVYASTWEVYGEPHYQPVDEKHPCEPDHPYNITKLAGERILLAADRLNDVPTIALRLGTAYGLGMRPNSVFEIFIRKAMAGEPITIQGDGTQGRQFTHATDIARAFVLASNSNLRNVAFNVVSPTMISIRRLAETIVERHLTEVTFGAPRPGDVAPSTVSSAAIRESLGWEPLVEFESGLEELLDVDRD